MRVLLTSTLLLALLLVCSCEKSPNSPEAQYNGDIELWGKLAGDINSYSWPRMFNLERADTIICTGLKNNIPWFAIYKKSNAEKIIEWTDIEAIDTAEVISINRGYGEVDEFKLGGIAPCFYKFYKGSSVVELTFCRYNPWMLNDIGPWGCNTEKYDLGLGLSQDLIGGGGYYSTIQKVIFTNESSRVVRDFTEYDSGYWPSHVIDGYKESVFIGNDCLTYNNQVLYSCKNPFPGIGNSNLNCFTSYDAYLEVYGLKCQKINIPDERVIWSKTITPPYEIPDGANPKTTIKRISLSEKSAKFHVSMLFYDGTTHSFNYEVDFSDGNITIM